MLLDLAPVLAPGCIVIDLRKAQREGLSVPRELKAQSVTLPTIFLDRQGPSLGTVVSAMKSGASDYLAFAEEDHLRASLSAALAECLSTIRPAERDETAAALVGRLTQREREVLIGLVEGGTNKTIAQKLGISPRTVELHRSQLMSRMRAGSLTKLLRIALASGLSSSEDDVCPLRRPEDRRS